MIAVLSCFMKESARTNGPLHVGPRWNAKISFFFKHAIQSLPNEACPLAKARSHKDGGATEEAAVR